MKERFTHRFGKLSLSLAVCCFTVAGAIPNEGHASAGKLEAYRSLAGGSIIPSLVNNPDATTVLPERVAQVVRGTVTDESGEPLPGVTVRLKGSNTVGTITDFDGNYTLDIPDDAQNPVLIFSFVGFLEQEVPVNNRSVIDVQLASDVKALEEVVVVGYGTQRREEITSAVASVSAEEFNKGNITDVSQLLQGKVH